jgi:uncharacterized membrane protein YedE/YeeE
MQVKPEKSGEFLKIGGQCQKKGDDFGYSPNHGCIYWNSTRAGEGGQLMKWIALLQLMIVLLTRLGMDLGALPPLRFGAGAELGILLFTCMSAVAVAVLPGKEKEGRKR